MAYLERKMLQDFATGHLIFMVISGAFKSTRNKQAVTRAFNSLLHSPYKRKSHMAARVELTAATNSVYKGLDLHGRVVEAGSYVP
jgi:rRNA maturation protein Rpf1